MEVSALRPWMRAIVTGTARSIGSHLVELLLADRFAVLVLDDLPTRGERIVARDSRLEVREMAVDERRPVAFAASPWSPNSMTSRPAEPLGRPARFRRLARGRSPHCRAAAHRG